MRDKNLPPEELNIQLSRILSRKLQVKRLTEAVLVDPTLQTELVCGPLSRRPSELFALTVVSFYAPDEALGFLLREQIEEKRLYSISFENRLALEILLSVKKEEFLLYLSLNEELSVRTFFGNIVPCGIDQYNKVRIYRRNLRNPTEPVWRRGYKDKGSLRPSHKWLPSFDISLTEEQNRQEQIKDLYGSYVNQVKTLLQSPSEV